MNIKTITALLKFIERVPVTGTQEAIELLTCQQELNAELQSTLSEKQSENQTTADDNTARIAPKRNSK